MDLLPMQCQLLILPIMELVVHLPCIQVVAMAATFKPLILANHQKHHSLTRASNRADKQGEHLSSRPHSTLRLCFDWCEREGLDPRSFLGGADQAKAVLVA